jgi:uncharacterized protein (DUF58 family)
MNSLGGRWSWPALLSLVVLTAGFVSGWQLLERLGIALLGLLTLCLLATLVTALALTAEGKPRTQAVTAGDMLVVVYTIRNRGFWPVVWTLLRPQGLSALPIEGQLVALPWHGDLRLDVAIPCPQRGRWGAGGCALHTGDPFGFFERITYRGGRDMITVYPRPIPMPGLQLPALIGRGIGPRGRPSPQPAATVREVRPYRSGDLPSRIHWLSSARMDALMVKEPEGEPASHVWLVLDLQSDVQYGDDEGDSVELLVGAASFLVRERLPAWIATGLLAIGPGTIVKPNSRRAQAGRLLHALAVAKTGEGSLESGLKTISAPYGSRHATVIVLTPWADTRWFDHLSRLVRAGHTVLCLVLDTPDSGRGGLLDAQADQLRRGGVFAYRHTSWAN